MAARRTMDGDPLHAVLIPPQLARFRELTGIGAATVVPNFTGWNKHVLLTEDTAFLFPRQAANVEWFEREIAAYQALEPTGLTLVPRLLGRWDDADVYPFPFAAVSRLAGVHPADPVPLLGELARAIARWHELLTPDLPGARPPAHHERPPCRWLRRALDRSTSAEAAGEAADRLDRADRLSRWTELLATAAELRPVLVHGDIHEDQLLAADGCLTGIVDWETARVDHPFWDFDFGEWGTGLWRQHRREFSGLWMAMWRAYAVERGLDVDPAPLEAAFRLRQALTLVDNGGDPLVVGTIDEHLAAV